MQRAVITGTGSYIPTTIQSNADFANHNFYEESSKPIPLNPALVVEKFRQITGIAERRYLSPHLNTSDIATISARRALEDSGTDPETLDQVIVAHNFGDVIAQTIQTDAVPSLATRVKHELGIRKPECVAYDVLFGCPGWIQSMIQADAFFKAGLAKKCLLIGAETLSRVIDIYDRDSMLFSDGAGACVIESMEVEAVGPGVLATAAQTHSLEEAHYIDMGKSYYPDSDPRIRFIKMKGRKVYEFAMKYVPEAMKTCLEKSGVGIHEIKKIFIHQANEKMDDGIIKRFYQLFGISEPPKNVVPMSIHWLGNSSVATIPTLYDMVRRKAVDSHQLIPGDVILFASVGAGMNVNAVCYRY